MKKLQHDLQIKFGSEYGEEEKAAVLRVLSEGAPTSGDGVVRFGEDFAAYCGTSYGRAVSNGTAALFLTLKAAGVGEKSRVLTTPLTWIASASAASTLGADVDFVDIDPVTYNMDPVKLKEKADAGKVDAVVPVHLYGQCCDMDPIMALSEQLKFAVIEDACHAIGAEYKGRKAGSMGTAGCFSFHEQKNMSTLGEGGMVVTNSAEIFETAWLYHSHCTRVYGKSTKYLSLDEKKFPKGKKFWFQDFDDTGYNFRMTEIQGAVGIEQLKKVDALNERRIHNAAYLSEALAGIPGIKTPVTAPGRKHVFHLYPIEIDAKAYGVDRTDFIFRMLDEYGIKVGTHYTPVHLSTAFRNRGFKEGNFPIAEDVMTRLVTLPINPRQTREALGYLVESIKDLHTKA
ncbi:MAG: DegT/DnrJ/EryC1/StrS family aminotransferase [Spirochaetales bacterium]|nr:MAG: DegT/DnrJ/EryC1/StrS family aminotransferase [Spirochaetales bacterium]